MKNIGDPCPREGLLLPQSVVSLACLHLGSAETAIPGGRSGEALLDPCGPAVQQWPLTRYRCCRGFHRDPAASWPAPHFSGQHSALLASLAVTGHRKPSRSCTLGEGRQGWLIQGPVTRVFPWGCHHSTPRSRERLGSELSGQGKCDAWLFICDTSVWGVTAYL